ncbi:MAG TPA: metallophosphoesterase family protein [Gemmataceae bacterium]|nr:metallophosphoesterase family protein [Gemmataceae bacterium]
MFSPSRRLFLGSSLAGLGAACLFAKDDPAKSLPKLTDDPPFRPDTLFLTWQRDPTTTMTVQWVGALGETTDTTVYHASFRKLCWGSKPAVAHPYPRTDLKVFRAELTGLEPGTDYQFWIGKQSPIYHFRTMPAKAADTIHFVSGGDCGVNSHAVANNIEAARQDPMFALLGGDLAYDNGTSAATNLAFLRNYSKHMIGRDGRLIPMIACIGNHEVVGSYHQPRAKAPFFYALFDGLYPEHGFAALDFGDYLSLVLLDTNHTTPIAGEQADWLEKTLCARKEHPNVFVVNHVPAYPSYRNPEPVKGKGSKEKGGTGADNRKHWVPLFEKYRVPVVLEHHDHTFKRTKPLLGGLAHDNGVLYLGDGSWGRLRTPKSPDKLSYLAASSRDYHLSLHRIQGRERFHLALDEHGRVMDACRSGQRRSGLVGASG